MPIRGHKRSIRALHSRKAEEFNLINDCINGEMLEKLSLDDNQVTFNLKPEHNKSVNYYKIRFALKKAYNNSKEFRSVFNKPKKNYEIPSLTFLDKNNKYKSPDEVITALKRFASPKKLKIRQALIHDKLFASAEIENQIVTFIMTEEYNNSSDYHSTYKFLDKIYAQSPTFKKIFESPRGNDKAAPSLTIKSEYRYQNGQQVLDSLKSFSTHHRNIIKMAIYNGRLFSDAKITDKRVDLSLQPEFLERHHFNSIWKRLNAMYDNSESFRRDFEKPITRHGNHILMIKSNCDIYQNGKQVLEALKDFAAEQPLELKEALSHGKLFSSASIKGNLVFLTLTPEYSTKKCHTVNQSLNRIYHLSKGFKDRFECPKFSNTQLVLTLKEGVDYKNPQDVLTDLQRFATPESQANPPVLESVTLPLTPIRSILDIASKKQITEGETLLLYRLKQSRKRTVCYPGLSLESELGTLYAEGVDCSNNYHTQKPNR